MGVNVSVLLADSSNSIDCVKIVMALIYSIHFLSILKNLSLIFLVKIFNTFR